MSAYALIAGSDAEDTANYKTIVVEAGLDAVEARDGESARRILHERGAPALFITELSLPRADGFALLGDLRKLASAETSPALVISAFPEIRATASMLSEQLGIREVLSTRAATSDLRRAVNESLQHAEFASRPGMKSPPGSPHEAVRGEEARLAQIARMEIVDDLPPDETLQRLVADVAKAFNVPIALVSLILEDRQWFKAYYGLEGKALEARGTPRDMSFCRHVVESDGSRPLVVPDASIHPYFASNPLVQQGLVRSYAGAPLVTPEGHVLGTLCIIDSKPLNIGPDEVDALVSLARRVAGELEARWSARRAAVDGKDSASLALMEAICSSVESGILVLDPDRRIVLANRALGQLFGMQEEQILSMSREEFILRCSVNSNEPQIFLRRLRVFPEGPFSAREHFEIARPRHRVIRWVAKPVHLPSGLGQLEIFDDLEAS